MTMFCRYSFVLYLPIVSMVHTYVPYQICCLPQTVCRYDTTGSYCIVTSNKVNGFYNYNFFDFLSGLRVATLNKRLNIQRRLAWSLCKDDTHNRREATPFFSPVTPDGVVHNTIQPNIILFSFSFIQVHAEC